MTDTMMYNDETILMETIDFDTIEKELARADEERYWQEIKDCGKPITTLSRKTGELVEHPHRRCRHYKDCPQCGKWKKQQEKDLLSPFIGVVRYLEVPREDEKKITRKYGSENIRRVPIDDNTSAFIIQTDDNIGELFTGEHCQKMVDNSIPTDNRRISGKLGVSPIGVVTDNCDKPEEGEEEVHLEDEEEAEPLIECHYREMDVKYNSDIEDAPQNVNDLNELMKDEVEVYSNPSSEEELQDAVYLCEQKVQEICQQYGMSFSFLSRKKDYLKLSDVKWQWTYSKRPPG